MVNNRKFNLVMTIPFIIIFKFFFLWDSSPCRAMLSLIINADELVASASPSSPYFLFYFNRSPFLALIWVILKKDLPSQKKRHG